MSRSVPLSHTYFHAHIRVMRVHKCAQVLVRAFAKKLFDKLVGIFEVVATAAPLPGLAVPKVRGLVTRAALHAACTASFGQRMYQPRRGDGIQEACFFKS